MGTTQEKKLQDESLFTGIEETQRPEFTNQLDYTMKFYEQKQKQSQKEVTQKYSKDLSPFLVRGEHSSI